MSVLLKCVLAGAMARGGAVRISPESSDGLARNGVLDFMQTEPNWTMNTGSEYSVEAEAELWSGASFENPAGCQRLSRQQGSFDLSELRGIYPTEDFEEMLFAYNFTNRGGGQSMCLARNRNEKWCPEPGGHAVDKVASDDLNEYLGKELQGVDRSQPVVVAVFQGAVRATSVGTQLANFLCGWERLGLLENRSAVFATDQGIAKQLRKLFPNARVLYHPGMEEAMNTFARFSNLDRKNRIWKLGVAQLLLNRGWDVLLSDVDVYWVRDPTPVFMEAARTDGLEFAAMRSLCWLELNSGFLYYRNTNATREMLKMALTTRRPPPSVIGGCRDNDQYLLNCGFARAAIKGLKYTILPGTDFSWAFSSPNLGGKVRCDHQEVQEPTGSGSRWIGDGFPYVWHTGGLSNDYSNQLDQFAAYDLIDINVTSGACRAGSRGARSDAEAVVELSSRACSSQSGGFVHAQCRGQCRPVDAFRAREVVAGFSAMLKRTGLNPKPFAPRAGRNILRDDVESSA